MAETTETDIAGMTFRAFATLFHGCEPVVEAGRDHFGMRASCHGRKVTATRKVVAGAAAFFTVVEGEGVHAFRRSLREASATPFSRRLAAGANPRLGLHVDADTPDAVVDRMVARYLALPREPRTGAVSGFPPRVTARGMSDLLACHRRAVDRVLAAGRDLDPPVRHERAMRTEDAWVMTIPAGNAFLFRTDLLPADDEPEAGQDDLATPRM